MKKCSACHDELPRSAFSGTQWKLTGCQRRCKQCVSRGRPIVPYDDNGVEAGAGERIGVGAANENGEVSAGAAAAARDPEPVSTAPTDAPAGKTCKGAADGTNRPSVVEDDRSCWICLESGPDTSGIPLRRDCSCRGDSGWVHIDCLKKFARSSFTDNESRFKNKDGMRLNPWESCNNCKQDFINTTAIELGKDYLKFAKMKYPNDEVEHILAQVLRLESLTSKNRDRTKRQTSEAQVVANVIIQKSRQVRHEVDTSGRLVGYNAYRHERALTFEAYACDILGCMIYEENGDLKRSLEYLNQALALTSQIDDTKENPTKCRIEGMIGMVMGDMSEQEGGHRGVPSESMIESLRLAHENDRREFGEVGESSLVSALQYMKALKLANHGIKAETMCHEMSSKIMRVHGKNHPSSSFIIESKATFMFRAVSFLPKDKEELAKFRPLDFNDLQKCKRDYYKFITYCDNDNCIIKGPFPVRDSMQYEEMPDKVVPLKDVVFVLSTPVLMKGGRSSEMGEAIYAIGDIHEYDVHTQEYTVMLEGRVPVPLKIRSKGFTVMGCYCENCLKQIEGVRLG